MAGKPGMPMPRWGKVEEARNYLNRKAHTIARLALTATKIAASKGNAEPAIELLKHLGGPDESGRDVRAIAPSIDKPAAQAQGDTGPKILIGINLGYDQKAQAIVETPRADNPRLSGQPVIDAAVESTTYDTVGRAKVEGETSLRSDEPLKGS